MYFNNKILVGKNDNKEANILLKMANRHGLITGASGSGKTITLKVLAESFSSAGVPVMLVDVKGDLAATCKLGEMNEKVQERVDKLHLEGFEPKAFPVTFFDVFKKSGHPIRTTIKDIGSRLLARMLDLTEAQEGVLAIAFQISEDEDKKLNDLQDLKSMLTYMGDNKDEYTLKYGNITTQTIAAIQRNLLQLEQEGGNDFFGKPELQLFDLMQFDYNGCGFINILDAQELFKKPTLYAVFLIWLLNNLFYNLPEVGDPERPKMVLFLDEAHLIFSEMNANLIKQITQVVKLIRSKGVGVYFISQAPSDIPDEILSQLSNKVQHVLRAYTPNDEKAIRAACNSFRPNPEFKTDEAIKALGTGEALVSFLTDTGEPSIVEKVTILPPQSRMGTISDEERDMVIKQSRLYGKYETEVNERSATEIVDEHNAEVQAQKEAEEKAKEEERIRKEEEKEALARAKEEEKLRKEEERARKEAEREAEKKKREEERERKNSIGYKLGKKATNKVVNKALDKAVGSIFKIIFRQK